MEQLNLESSAAIKAKYAQVQEKILETFVSMAKVTKKLNESSAEVKCERFNSDSAFSNKVISPILTFSSFFFSSGG